MESDIDFANFIASAAVNPSMAVWLELWWRHWCHFRREMF